MIPTTLINSPTDSSTSDGVVRYSGSGGGYLSRRVNVYSSGSDVTATTASWRLNLARLLSESVKISGAWPSAGAPLTSPLRNVDPVTNLGGSEKGQGLARCAADAV